MTELSAHRTLALREALANDPDTAFLAVLHAMALQTFYGSYTVGCAGQTSVEQVQQGRSHDDPAQACPGDPKHREIVPGHVAPAEPRMGDHANAPRRHTGLHRPAVNTRTQGKMGLCIREPEERCRIAEAITGQSLLPQHRILERNRQG
jgi:hypothetical protein